MIFGENVSACKQMTPPPRMAAELDFDDSVNTANMGGEIRGIICHNWGQMAAGFVEAVFEPQLLNCSNVYILGDMLILVKKKKVFVLAVGVHGSLMPTP